MNCSFQRADTRRSWSYPGFFHLNTVFICCAFSKRQVSRVGKSISRFTCPNIWHQFAPICADAFAGRRDKGAASPFQEFETKAQIAQCVPSATFKATLSVFIALDLTWLPPILLSREFLARCLASGQFVFCRAMNNLQLPIPPSLPRQIATAVFGMRHDRILDNSRIRWP